MANIDLVTEQLGLCPAFSTSPLLQLEARKTAPRVIVKDETNRLGMGSFKALGGTYAVFRVFHRAASEVFGSDLSFSSIFSDAVRPLAKSMTFCCASAGNHGLAVAAAAHAIGSNSTIFVSENVPPSFVKRLKEKGAIVIRTGQTYDDSMLAARAAATDNGRVLVADSSWEGYTEIPRIIMNGYSIIANEIESQCAQIPCTSPTHIFLQAGVGGLAGAIANYVRARWKSQPRIIVVEPDRAPCLQASAKAGKPIFAGGSGSVMGRLDCAEPSIVAFDILRNYADGFLTISDNESEQAVKELAGLGVHTSPSGAAGYAGMQAIFKHSQLREKLDLNFGSVCLVIATETSIL
ncbi:MAG: diaminopropionate ammonia-lyase [Parvibaculaceae bacterium]